MKPVENKYKNIPNKVLFHADARTPRCFLPFRSAVIENKKIKSIRGAWIEKSPQKNKETENNELSLTRTEGQVSINFL